MTTTTKPTTGVFYKVPRNAYDLMAGCNQSRLKMMLSDTPAHARHDMLFPSEPSDAMLLGLAFEKLLLFGENAYNGSYAVWRGARRQGKEWEAFEAGHLGDGRQILTAAQDQAAQLMVLSLHEHITAGKVLARGGDAQAVLRWEDGGLLCRAMLDQFITDEWPTIVDIKTAASVATEDIGRTVVNFGYDVQAAFYRRGARALGYDRANFLFVFIETGGGGGYPKPGIVNAAGEPRCAVRVVELDDRTLARGEEIVDSALDLYRACEASGRWDAYPDRIEVIGAPEWALKVQR